jgi:hypothetical protein
MSSTEDDCQENESYVPEPPVAPSDFYSESFAKEKVRDGTDDPPLSLNSPQYHLARDSIKTHQERILHLESEVRRLRRDIRSSRLEVTCCGWQIAPIRRVPDEILAEIFANDVLHTSFYEFHNKHNPSPLLSILLTCRRWYQVATQATQLWRHVEIRYDKRAWKHRDLHRLFDQWLTRSRQAPLSVQIHAFGNVENNYVPGIAFQRIFREFPRWRTLELANDGASSRIVQHINQCSRKEELLPQVSNLHTLMLHRMSELDPILVRALEKVGIGSIVRMEIDCRQMLLPTLGNLLAGASDTEVLSIRQTLLYGAEDTNQLKKWTASSRLPRLKKLSFQAHPRIRGIPYIQIFRSLLSSETETIELSIPTSKGADRLLGIHTTNSSNWVATQPPLPNVHDLWFNFELGLRERAFLHLGDTVAGFKTFLAAFPNVRRISVQSTARYDKELDVNPFTQSYHQLLTQTRPLLEALEAVKSLEHLQTLELKDLLIVEESLSRLKRCLMESSEDNHPRNSIKISTVRCWIIPEPPEPERKLKFLWTLTSDGARLTCLPDWMDDWSDAEQLKWLE